MSSSLSRFVRMLMLALVLGVAAAQPAAADDGPSILRDTETEALFQDVAKPLIEGLSHETVVTDPSGMEALPARDRIPLDQALREAVAEMPER